MQLRSLWVDLPSNLHDGRTEERLRLETYQTNELLRRSRSSPAPDLRCVAAKPTQIHPCCRCYCTLRWSPDDVGIERIDRTTQMLVVESDQLPTADTRRIHLYDFRRNRLERGTKMVQITWMAS